MDKFIVTYESFYGPIHTSDPSSNDIIYYTSLVILWVSILYTSYISDMFLFFTQVI